MRHYTNFYCNHCGKLKGLQTDHSVCSKELQKLKQNQAKPATKKQYKNNKHITTFLKSIGAE